MYYVICLNKKGERFTKEFSSPYLMDKFIAKCKYSKDIKVIGSFKD